MKLSERESLTAVRDRLQEEFDNLTYPVRWGTFMLGRVAQLEVELKAVSMSTVSTDLTKDMMIAQLEAKLLAHQENEGDECPLCALEEENETLWDVLKINNLGDIATMRLDSLKEGE